MCIISFKQTTLIKFGEHSTTRKVTSTGTFLKIKLEEVLGTTLHFVFFYFNYGRFMSHSHAYVWEA